MKATELRIGNLVKGKEINVYWTVEAIDSNSIFSHAKWRSLDAFEPIPLTEDFLLKFGFEEIYNSQFRLKFDHIKHQEIGFDFSKVEDKSMQGFRFYGHYIKIHHVHQLQNLYFALTGEELTLKNK